MIPSSDHIHKYKRVTLSKRTGAKVFKCQVPGCSRFMSRDLVIGERSQCWKCGLGIVLTRENTRVAKPTCLNCRNRYTKNEETGKRVFFPIEEIRKIKSIEDLALNEFLKNLKVGE